VTLRVGDFVDVEITESDEHDLYGDALPPTAVPAARKTLDLKML
jgi:ribosomal protein S12 methylthiotransferase